MLEPSLVSVSSSIRPRSRSGSLICSTRSGKRARRWLLQKPTRRPRTCTYLPAFLKPSRPVTCPILADFVRILPESHLVSLYDPAAQPLQDKLATSFCKRESRNFRKEK